MNKLATCLVVTKKFWHHIQKNWLKKKKQVSNKKEREGQVK